MRDNEQTSKIELLSQWKLEAEFRNSSVLVPTGFPEVNSYGHSTIKHAKRTEILFGI